MAWSVRIEPGRGRTGSSHATYVRGGGVVDMTGAGPLDERYTLQRPAAGHNGARRALGRPADEQGGASAQEEEAMTADTIGGSGGAAGSAVIHDAETGRPIRADGAQPSEALTIAGVVALVVVRLREMDAELAEWTGQPPPLWDRSESTAALPALAPAAITAMDLTGQLHARIVELRARFGPLD